MWQQGRKCFFTASATMHISVNTWHGKENLLIQWHNYYTRALTKLLHPLHHVVYEVHGC